MPADGTGISNRPIEDTMDERGTNDESRNGDDATRGAAAPPSATHAPKHRRMWPLKLFGIVVVVPLLIIAAWTAIALSKDYSTGERAGFVQKFSQKGWVCKTWEGDIAMVNLPTAVQERFAFSVRNDSVAHEISKLMGSRVVLTYEQHKAVPGSCFGETEYFVTGVRPIGGP